MSEKTCENCEYKAVRDFDEPCESCHPMTTKVAWAPAKPSPRTSYPHGMSRRQWREAIAQAVLPQCLLAQYPSTGGGMNNAAREAFEAADAFLAEADRRWVAEANATP